MTSYLRSLLSGLSVEGIPFRSTSDMNEAFHSINRIGSPLNTVGVGTRSLFIAMLSWIAWAIQDMSFAGAGVSM